MLVSSNASDSKIKKRRKKKKRVAAIFLITVLSMVAHWYRRKRYRQIVSVDEVVERDVLRRKQMLRNLYEGEAARTAAESSKEMAKEDNGAKETSSDSGRLKKQRSDDSFTSMMSEKLDMLAEALKDGPKEATPKEILAALEEIPGLNEETTLDLFDILTADARKSKSLLPLPMEWRKRWLLKQLKK